MRVQTRLRTGFSYLHIRIEQVFCLLFLLSAEVFLRVPK